MWDGKAVLFLLRSILQFQLMGGEGTRVMFPQNGTASDDILVSLIMLRSCLGRAKGYLGPCPHHRPVVAWLLATSKVRTDGLYNECHSFVGIGYWEQSSDPIGLEVGGDASVSTTFRCCC